MDGMVDHAILCENYSPLVPMEIVWSATCTITLVEAYTEDWKRLPVAHNYVLSMRDDHKSGTSTTNRRNVPQSMRSPQKTVIAFGSVGISLSLCS